MSLSRRQLLAACGASLGGLVVPSIAQAAAASSDRFYVSPLNIRKIAVRLVAGIARETWRYLVSINPDRLHDFIERFDAERFVAHVPALRDNLELEFDRLVFTVDNVPKIQKLGEYLTAIEAITHEDADRELNQTEADQVRALFKEARGKVLQDIAEGKTLRLSYNVRYKQAYFRVANYARLGHVRVDLTLLRPVRIFNGAAFVADLKSAGEHCTNVYTSLWGDVCIGRREGPIVRRIAERQISCREASFLAEVEHEVQVLVRGTGESKLSQMIPELMRRIAEGGFQS